MIETEIKTKVKSKSETQKNRSPNYPAISLPEAIERIRKVYDSDGIKFTNREVVAKALGYSGLSGPAVAVVSALKKYNLLVGSGGGNYLLTDVAIDILGDNSSKKNKAIHRAACAPTLFSELLEEFGQSQISDHNLVASLLKRGFSKSATSGVIRAYRETLDFLSKHPKGSEDHQAELHSEAVVASPESNDDPVQQKPVSARVHGVFGWSEVLSCKVAPNCSGRVLFDGPITQQNIGRLIQHLELAKDAFPVKEERAEEQKDVAPTWN